MTGRSYLTLGLGLSIGLFAGPLQAAPDQPAPQATTAPSPAQIADANRHFRQGVDLFKEGAAAAALAEFRRAYLLAPDWHVLYNIALSHAELNNWAAAYLAYDQYSREATGISPQRRAEVAAQLRRLESRIGRVRITTSVAASDVFIDDEPIGKAPLAGPAVVNVGMRKITVTTPSGATATRMLEVAVGDDVPVDVSLGVENAIVEPPPPPSTPVPSVTESSPPVWKPASAQTPTWIGWALAGALAGSAVVTGTFAVKSQGDANDAKDRLGVSDDALASANQRKHTFALTTDILGGAALVTAAVTLYLTLRSPTKRASAALPWWSPGTSGASTSPTRLDYRF